MSERRARRLWRRYRKAGDIRLSRAVADAVERHAELEIGTQSLSIPTFRYVLRASVAEHPPVAAK